ncbi:prolyl oligopeptidase family serine peptidase [Pauljensenia sp. UMB0018B]|uniref:S9 family peptidase n=1 Tax=Schaalia odontolytica TaxID=1660 RepID=A0A2I1HYW0_9ACTO|nr:prolyl oligopeptidase family serine peptidase [Schaalia odontolytica]MDK7340259.1 prolyl oligopeptidase family serine peptidase [Pauljensenia sp. UMB0018B]PKY64065.1 S9 family peptidase [Schaalia odontolytica]
MVHMIDTTTREAANASSMNTPPVAPKRYGYRVRDQFGQHFDDPWDWLRDGEDPEVRAHLEAENAWADTVTAPTREAAARLVEEVKASTALTDVTVPIREGEFWYFRRFAEGQSYATHHRAPVERDEAGAPIPLVPEPGVPTPGEELLVDENEWARGQEFFRLADMYPSPDGRLIAWARDTSGDERYTWVVQEASGRVIDEAVVDAGYGFAWADDSASFIYMGVDDAWRACDVWLHRVGTPRETDELLLVEPDEGFEMGFAPSGFPGHVVIHASSSTAGRAWLWLPAHPSVRPLPLMPVRPRTLVSADSAGDRLFIVHTGLTQEGSLAQAMLPEGGSPEALARLGVTSSSAFSRGSLADRTPGTPLPEDEPAPLTPFESWEPLRSPGPGERITDVEAHAGYVALSLRSGSLTQVDVWDRREPTPTWRRVEVDAPVRTIATVPTPWEDSLRVEFQSQTVPPTVAEVALPDLAPASSPEDTSETAALSVRTLRAHEAPGWDPAEFVEERVWVLARDGATRIPVTLIHHRDTRPDGTHAGWQIGYGSYEVSYDPEFETLRLPILRRVVYAIAHVRGGGEMGRAWYEDGKELVKEHTFTDFIDVADWLVDSGWVAPGRLVAEGRSAGGLLMGAVTNAAPDRFRAILAGVPFVDALSTILDPSLPLTVGEWEEWGNPLTSRAVFDAMSRYTPYENVPDGALLPAIMATTSVNDTRVEFVEPTKWVQRLREATGQVPSTDEAGAGKRCNCCDSEAGEASASGEAGHGLVAARDPLERPIILRTEMVAGHAGPSGREGRWAARCEEFAFALGQVGVTV